MRSFILVLLFISSIIYPQHNSTKLSFSEKAGFYSSELSKNNNFFDGDNLQPEKKYYSPINYFGQAAVGSGLSILFALPPFSASFLHSWNNGGDDVIRYSLSVLTITSYLFGAATGVHWVAGVENKSLSYWKTFGYSVTGGGVGAILLAILARNYHNIPAFGGYLVAFSPVIGSMFYTSFVADFKSPVKVNKNSQKINSLKDLVNAESIKLNILQINF